jgi:DNA-binding IclR family transcriptional regulator
MKADHKASALKVTNSLERALALLELLHHVPGGLTNGEISRRLRIPTSTCSYITSRLERRGYLHRDSNTHCFKIGLSALALAYGALRELGFRAVAEPVLYRVAGETRLSAGIGVLEQGMVLLVDRIESPAFVRSVVEPGEGKNQGSRERTRDQRDIGRQMPAHTTALGKVLLAGLPEQELLHFLDEHTLTPSTHKTIVSKPKLLRELEAVRRQGYATADEELYPGVRALAVPILDAMKTVKAAISLNGNCNLAAWEDMQALLGKVEEAAREISIGLAETGPRPQFSSIY